MKGHDLAFLCNAGCEHEYLGTAEVLSKIAPPVSEAAFQLHLGAMWAGANGTRFLATRALPSLELQRFLSVSPSLLPLA